MKYAISLYKSSFRYLVLVGLTIVLPILFIYTLLVNYITLPFQLFNIPLWSTFFKIYFSAIAFALIQIPYISIFVQDLRHGNAISFGKDLLEGFRSHGIMLDENEKVAEAMDEILKNK